MNGYPRLPWFTAALSVCAVAVAADNGLSATLAYDRVSIGGGQLWRLFTGHLTHWGVDHLLWDAVMFAALGVTLESRSRRGLILCTALSAAAISAGLWLMMPSMTQYRGLSGIDSALFTAAASLMYCEAKAASDRTMRFVCAAALLGFVGKVAYELASGHTLFVDSSEAGFTPLPSVHLIGAAVGLMSGWMLRRSGTCTATRADPPTGPSSLISLPPLALVSVERAEASS